ncbi:hypothetical protein [Natronocalculus amylovorans]|uniref:PIN domain-containing protein n=1 Tax=Natronocalculus amylovorans TaxID=2917812 RepID=A0AAE3FZS0_9EURY|nr:hypothetical protein [Natronocalculus amylovorans]MCL9818341.1 hypothetical protein [Natronocalculus amylovorans]
MIIDLPDSNILIQAIVWDNSKAEDYLYDIVRAKRYAYIPRYVIVETYNKSTVASSKRGESHCLDMLEYLHSLDTTLMANPRNVLGHSRFYQYYTEWNDYSVTPNNLSNVRNSSMALILSDILDNLERKDAPILAEAHKICRLSEPAVLTKLGGQSEDDLYKHQEEMVFAAKLASNSIYDLDCRIHTNDEDFSDVDPSQIGIDNVVIKEVDL